MSGPGHGRERALIDRHFARRSTGADDSAMRDHLAGCRACHAYYERHLLLAELDPRSPPAIDRIAASLGFPGGRPPPRRRAAFLTMAGAVAMGGVVLAVTGWPGAGRSTDDQSARAELVARGAGPPVVPGSDPLLMVYRVSPGRPSRRVGSAIARGEELAFSYQNPSGYQRLMIFGVDERRNVYWYYPSWTEPAANPVAVPIAATSAWRELPEAIRQPFGTGTLRLLAIFANQPLSVRQIEQLVASPIPSADCQAVISQLPGAACTERAVTVRNGDVP
jgi:hypothetical protein